MIKQVIDQTDCVPTVVSFWPHPREVLFGEPRLRLDLPTEKLELLAPLGIEQLVLIPFTFELAKLNPKQFVDSILIGTLNAQMIAVGANFRFGRERSGNADLLRELAANHKVDVRVVEIVEDGQGRMSSSRIRKALELGDLNNAKKLLGRSYQFQGKVVKGRGLGRQLGWPTANLQVDGRKFLPGLGVYAAWAKVDFSEKKFAAIMNLGPQPTIDPNAPSAVEVHLLDYNINLVNQTLIIEPVKRLRGQKKFSNLKSLCEQIGNDAMQARQLLCQLDKADKE